MTSTAALAYAQARLQARYAEAPDEGEWSALESAVHFATALERARETRLGRWVAMFSTTSSVHAIELGLREQLRRLIEEVAGWLPQAWAPAVRWTRVLIDLPALTHLMQGYPAPAWMQQDPALRDVSVDDAAERRAALARGEMAALVSAWEAGEPLSLAWLQEWRGRWPETSADEAARLNELAALLRQHLDVFASVPRERAWEERRALRHRLKYAFRRDFLQPTAAFAYLAIAALDLERLRAALVSRALFAPREGSP